MNIQFGLKKVSRSTDFRVRRATNEDLPAIAKHLHNDHVQRPFGYHFDEAELRQRFEMWPQFDINSFYLAEDGAGRLQGMCATWDAQTTKRYRVLGYHRWMRWKRWGFNAASVFTGAPALPSINGVFRYFYLTHVSVPSENPAVMSALVDRVYADNHGKGYHFFTACVYRDDPLREAYRPYMQNSLPACLYAMSAPEHERDNYDYGAGRTGFEMAFA